MADELNTTIFLHIPKAGGNSLLEFLRPNYPEDAHFDVSLGLKYVDRLNELETMPAEQQSRFRFISGHLPFGIHQFLPQQSRYITVLRDPIDRVVSHYYFVREQRKHPLHDAVMSKNMTVADYVTSGLSGELNNGMVRLICGRAESDSLRGHAPCEDGDLRIALDHLRDHFEVVGLLEQIDATQQLLSRVFGWPERSSVRKNKTKVRKSTASLKKKEREIIASHNAMDIELYRWASERFENDCAKYGISIAPQERGLTQRLLQPFDFARRYLGC
ncbi:MAG: sulfotransferase family 2 domain-containing protein [Planctomycetales bacterium]|nr:sulfotransferase family 2 domain-containing protein [Planctomycetales bacterium]